MGTDLQGVCALLDAVGLSRSRFRYVCLSRSHCGYLAVVFVFHFVVPQGPVPPLKSAPLFGLWSVRFPCFPARPGMQCVLQFHFSSTIIHACVRSCTKRRRCHARATAENNTTFSGVELAASRCANRCSAAGTTMRCQCGATQQSVAPFSMQHSLQKAGGGGNLGADWHRCVQSAWASAAPGSGRVTARCSRVCPGMPLLGTATPRVGARGGRDPRPYPWIPW